MNVKTDKQIREDVIAELRRNDRVKGAEIGVTVSDGWVTLEGEVETYSRRDDVVSAVRNLAGVIGVRNWIVVELPLIEPEEVREVIQGVLERRADRLADRINISVDGGQVTLKGSVRSKA